VTQTLLRAVCSHGALTPLSSSAFDHFAGHWNASSFTSTERFARRLPDLDGRAHRNRRGACRAATVGTDDDPLNGERLSGLVSGGERDHGAAAPDLRLRTRPAAAWIRIEAADIDGALRRGGAFRQRHATVDYAPSRVGPFLGRDEDRRDGRALGYLRASLRCDGDLPFDRVFLLVSELSTRGRGTGSLA
jgi:hypothetical protein